MVEDQWQVQAMGIAGAWVVTPRQFFDERGVFLESFRGDLLAEAIGHRLDVMQTNVSVSSRGTVRGIHFAEVPPSQAKYVTCLAGALLDVVVDVRVGSPTFGQWDAVRLDPAERKAVYVAEGLGHGFVALEDDTTAHYLCSSTYHPAAEHGINPLDPALGLPLPDGLDLILSEKDAAAPTLEAAAESGLLPSYDVCARWYAELGDRGEASR